MNCAEKLLEPTIFFNLYTKSPYKPFLNQCVEKSQLGG